MQKVFAILIILFCSHQLCAQGVVTNIDSILIAAKQKDECKAIYPLFQAASYYANIHGNKQKSDSLLRKAISIAEKENDKALRILSYIEYSKYCNNESFDDATQYIDKGLQLARKLKSREQEGALLIAKGVLLAKQGNIEGAIQSILSSKNLLNENKELEYYYHSSLGDIYRIKDDTYAALENYNQAKVFATALGNDSLIFDSYIRKIQLAIQGKLHINANTYLNNAKEFLKEKKGFSKYEDLCLKSLEQVLISYTNPINVLRLGLKQIQEAKVCNFLLLEQSAYSDLRNSFIQSGDFQSMSTLYKDPAHQANLLKLKAERKNLYYRILAFMAENDKNIDSAKNCWQQSEALLPENNKAYKANFYMRRGDFYHRCEEYPAAINTYLRAKDLAIQSGYLPMAIEATALLEKAYQKTGNIQAAYEALKQNVQLADSNSQKLQSDRIFTLDNDTEIATQETEAAKLASDESRSHTFQLFCIGALIIILLFVLIWLSKRPISITALRWFGYLTFIFTFEFFIFLCHGLFHKITHEPIYLMLMNVSLIAILLPLHHATEHRVLQYLIHKNRITHDHKSLKEVVMGWINRYRKFVTIETKEHDE